MFTEFKDKKSGAQLTTRTYKGLQGDKYPLKKNSEVRANPPSACNGFRAHGHRYGSGGVYMYIYIYVLF